MMNKKTTWIIIVAAIVFLIIGAIFWLGFEVGKVYVTQEAINQAVANSSVCKVTFQVP